MCGFKRDKPVRHHRNLPPDDGPARVLLEEEEEQYSVIADQLSAGPQWDEHEVQHTLTTNAWLPTPKPTPTRNCRRAPRS